MAGLESMSFKMINGILPAAISREELTCSMVKTRWKKLSFQTVYESPLYA